MACEHCQSTEKSISDDEVSDCISEKVDEGWDRERAVAACLSMAEEGSTEPDSIDGVEYLARLFNSDKESIQASVEDVDTTPTQEMADKASQVLEKIDDTEIDNDDCGTRTGLERANQLENREELSADTVGRMVSFFARHDGNQEVDDDVDSKWEDCGYVAWQLWGGDPGRDWANRKQEEIEDAEEDPEKQVDNTMTSKQELKNSIESQESKTADKRLQVNAKDVELVKQDSETEPVINIPIQALTEDRDGDIINEKGQESIIRQLKSGTVPLVPNHGVGESEAHYGFEDIFGQFVDGENRNGTTIATARLLEGNEFADKLIELLENDMPVGFSVGFRVLEGDERKEEGGMEIEKVDLMEVSAVGIPSNPEAVPQAMGNAVAMAKTAGLDQKQIVKTVKQAFNDTMSNTNENKDGTDQKQEEQDSKSGEQSLKQMTSEDVEMAMEVVSGKVSEHMGMAMDEAEDEILGMLDEEDMEEEEETDEMDEEEEDEEEMNQSEASDHSEDSEKDGSSESADEKSEQTEKDESLEMPENGKQGGKIKEASETEQEEKSKENKMEDPFAVRSL